MTASPWPDEPDEVEDDRPDAMLEALDDLAAADAAAISHDQRVTAELNRLRARDEAQRRYTAERAGTQARPDLVRLDEFLAVDDPPVTYRVDRLLRVGARVVLSAQYKAGKSTLLGNLVRSLVDGDPFLGEFTTDPVKNVVLIDNELDQDTLRAWLRDQGVVNTRAVRLLPLRGRVGTFDILDPTIRAEWATMLRGAQVLLFDCLRPALDALGLDESREAGRFLVPFDALLHDAGVSEAVVVHHMGHSGERSRGDSRILDWPDASWTLVRDDADDPASPRYLAAYGRDVDVRQGLITYQPDTRHLTFAGGTRKEARRDRALDDLVHHVVEAVRDHPGAHVAQIKEWLRDNGITYTNGLDSKACAAAVDRGLLRTEPGSRNRRHHYPIEPGTPTTPTTPDPLRGTVPEPLQPLLIGGVAREGVLDHPPAPTKPCPRCHQHQIPEHHAMCTQCANHVRTTTQEKP